MNFALAATLAFFCHETTLVSNTNVTIHRFQLQSDCQTALEELHKTKNLFYCDGAQLFNALYGQSHLMNFAADCRQAIVEAEKHNGYYCYERGMFNWMNINVASFYFRSECREHLPTF